MSESDQQYQSSTNTRVAVDVLQENQRDVLFRGAPDRKPPLTPLTEPFEDRRALVNWWQAAAVRTFGHLPTFFPAGDILRDGRLTSALIGEDTDADAHTRQRILEKTLEATRRSYRDLEVRATEWLSENTDGHDDYRRIDPTNQQHIAMRPAFSRLDREQAKALTRLWGGFEDRLTLSEWVHSLPSIVDFNDVLDQPLPAYLARSGHARRMLCADTDAGRVYRERFAAGLLLPAMGNRAKKLRASERPANIPDQNPWNEV